MSDFINLDLTTSKLLTAVGYAVVVLPTEARSAIVDRILDDIDMLLEDPGTIENARPLLTSSRRKLLSRIASASLKFKLAHEEELNAVAQEDKFVREKRRISVRRARHKRKYLDDYKPPEDD